MIVLAHHVELEHLPVLGIFLTVGIWLGWHVVSLALRRDDKQPCTPPTPAP
jgi:hypothetical protein